MMKPKLTIISLGGIIGAFSVGPFSAVYAIDPPPDEAQPPAALNQQDGPEPNVAKPVKPLPFVGLATATLPEMVADHLDLDSGSGVIIRTVYPGGPADKAGLTVNDIILKIDGTAVGNPEVITELVSGRQIGDRLSLDLIHKGKPSKVEVTVGERPADLSFQLDQEPMLEGIPELQADRLRGLLEQNRKAFGFGNDPAELFPDAQLEETLKRMRERMNQAMEAAPLIEPKAEGGIQLQNSSTIRMMDNNGSIEIKSTGDNTEVTVRDLENQVVWSGPWDTEQDKAAAPEEIRERINRVKVIPGKGFGFRFRDLKPAPDMPDN